MFSAKIACTVCEYSTVVISLCLDQSDRVNDANDADDMILLVDDIIGDSQERINISGMEVDESNRYDTDEEGGMRIDDDIYIPPPLRTFCEVDTTGPRLMITKIVNVNFKSYAGTTTIGPFHKVNFNITYSYLSVECDV